MAVDEAHGSQSGADALRFDVTRFVLVPAHDDVAIVELAGVFHSGGKRSIGRPRLVVTTADGSTESKALDAEIAHAGPDPDPWSACFAIPRELAEAADVTFGLAVGRSAALDLDAPTRQAPATTNPNADVEGQSWGGMVVDLSEARRELAEAQDELEQARAEIEQLRTESREREDAAASQPKPAPVTWLEEVEAEDADDAELPDVSSNGHAPEFDDETDDDEDLETGGGALPVLASRRIQPPPTTEHDAVYEATLKRLQVDRRARLRRRRILGRLLALIVFLLAAAAIYIVVEGVVGVDVIEIF